LKAIFKDGSGGFWVPKAIAEHQVGGSLKLSQLSKQGLLRSRQEHIGGKSTKLYNTADLRQKPR
jgi:hypothetical protein